MGSGVEGATLRAAWAAAALSAKLLASQSCARSNVRSCRHLLVAVASESAEEACLANSAATRAIPEGCPAEPKSPLGWRWSAEAQARAREAAWSKRAWRSRPSSS
eukprot:scaffold28860_cov90-Isochrysis_galbana.AAC.2